MIQHYAITWEMREIQDLTYRELAKLENDQYLDDYLDCFHILTTPWLPLTTDPIATEATCTHPEDDHGP